MSRCHGARLFKAEESSACTDCAFVCTYLHMGTCTWMQLPTEHRGTYWSYRRRCVTWHRYQELTLEEQHVLLTTEPVCFPLRQMHTSRSFSGFCFHNSRDHHLTLRRALMKETSSLFTEHMINWKFYTEISLWRTPQDLERNAELYTWWWLPPEGSRHVQNNPRHSTAFDHS